MIRYLAKRILSMILVLFIVVTITFILVEQLPGTPYPQELVRNEVQLKNLIDKYGLEDPPLEKYKVYMSNLVKGDLGYSLVKNREVGEVLSSRVPISAMIGILPVIFGTVIGVLLGVLAAVKRNTIWDYLSTGIAVLGISLPSFVLGPILQYYIAGEWKLLPATYDDRIGVSSIILPIIALSILSISQMARYTRSEMIEALNSDFIMLARAKGLSNTKVIWKHAFRNALIPILTILPISLVSTMMGALVTETIFGIPGMGKTMADAIFGNDYNMILGVAFFYTLLTLIGYLLVDICYIIADPRIRISGGKG